MRHALLVLSVVRPEVQRGEEDKGTSFCHQALAEYLHESYDKSEEVSTPPQKIFRFLIKAMAAFDTGILPMVVTRACGVLSFWDACVLGNTAGSLS